MLVGALLHMSSVVVSKKLLSTDGLDIIDCDWNGILNAASSWVSPSTRGAGGATFEPKEVGEE
jgi:hypothetical protein